MSHFTQNYSFWGFSSVTQSCAILCDPMDPAHRLPCPSPTSRLCSDSCPLIRWCHPTISSSVPFSSFPASWSFPVSQFFTSGGQSIGASALTSVLAMNIQDWFHLGLTGLISSQSKELSRTFSKYLNSKASILQCSAFFMVQLSHPYVTTGTFGGRNIYVLLSASFNYKYSIISYSHHVTLYIE